MTTLEIQMPVRQKIASYIEMTDGTHNSGEFRGNSGDTILISSARAGAVIDIFAFLS
jgi:hypothetical protein